jgi:HTH-type transcriptional regulator / antitoxin HigA
MADVRPIRTKDDYDAALLEVERLWGAKLGTPDEDRLDVLATLIDSYEQTHHPMDPPDPIEAIKFRMSQKKLTRKQLEPMIGTRTRVAEVLNRRRNLSIQHDSSSACNARHFCRSAHSTISHCSGWETPDSPLE